MPVSIATFPSLPAFLQTVTISNVKIGIYLYYNSRMKSWYMDLSNSDGSTILSGQRLSPSTFATGGLALPGLPIGMFTVQGIDNYSKDALGTQLTLWWWTKDELDAIVPKPTDYGLIVEEI